MQKFPQIGGTAALSTSVEVVPDSCARVADIIATMVVPADREETSLPRLPRGSVANFFLALVAICHQTSPRGRPALEGSVGRVHRRGWDYLLARFEAAASEDLRLLTPAHWAGMSKDDIRRLFYDERFGDRLTDPTGRAELLRNLGSGMISRGWTTADDLYQKCNAQIATGQPNLRDVLASFKAYRDPVRKKSYYFLALMRNSGLWRYADDEALGPPVDYHEVRGHLRLGTVRVTDPLLLEMIRAGRKVSADHDIAIRQAVSNAISGISERSGVRNPIQLHYFFWNLFRSVCTRDLPQCLEIKLGSLPARYESLVAKISCGCPFASICPSSGLPHPICEHEVDTDYY